MRRGLAHSFALHLAIILLVVFGLPHFGEDEVMTAMPIAVEVVSANQVASAPQRAHNPPPSPPKPAPPPPPTPPEPTPPPPPPEPAPSPDTVPPPPSEQPKPPEPTPVKQPPVPRPRPPQPKPAPTAQPQPKPATPQRDDQFANLLSNLSSQTPDDKPPREGVADSPVDDSPNISSLLNGGEMDAVRQQVMGCWLEPTGLKEGEQYVVEIKVEVNQDRTVRSAKVVDSPKMRTDPFYRTLGESAVRALYNPRCSPLMLPEGKYSTWHSITFRFSPGGVL